MRGQFSGFLAICLLTVGVPAFGKTVAKAPAKAAVRKIASSDLKCSEDAGKGMDVDFIIRQAESAATCGQAARAVEACGFGSSQDSATTDVAIDVCEKKTGKLSAVDSELKKMMVARCKTLCDSNREGTDCLARQAFCRLEVAKFIAAVNNID